MEVFIYEIKLTGEDEFAEKFNHVSDLFAIAMDETLSEEKQKEAWQNYTEAKMCLEMGM